MSCLKAKIPKNDFQKKKLLIIVKLQDILQTAFGTLGSGSRKKLFLSSMDA